MKRCITMLLRLLIRFYQLAISPLKPGCCRYYPTCSTYTLQAIEKYGPLKGSWMGLKRILRCHPSTRVATIQFPNPRGIRLDVFCESNFHHHHQAQFWKYLSICMDEI